MRIDRSLKFLTIMIGVAACSAPADSAPPAAAAPVADAPAPVAAPAAAASPTINVNLRWDSGPLDLAYRNERRDLDARHAQEIAHPPAGETIVIRDRRVASENKALEVRYERGKKDHLRSLPPQ